MGKEVSRLREGLYLMGDETDIDRYPMASTHTQHTQERDRER